MGRITSGIAIVRHQCAERRAFRPKEAQSRFWTLALKYPELRKGVVRVARAKEIQYFWTTIWFDIEEPFFAIETPTNVFVVQLTIEKGIPVLFWLDRVDDLHKPKK